MHQVLAWQDNLIWLIEAVGEGTVVAVDGPEAGPVDRYCAQHSLRLVGILNTHVHPDHVGINGQLRRRGDLEGMRVWGARARADDIPGLTDPLAEGDRVVFGGVEGTVLETPGHQDGHLSFAFDGAVFCGDTLFGGGCGYLFDGPAAAMFDSLSRLADLPEATRVCCAHEYTQDNLRFAWTIDDANPHLAARIREVWALRAGGGCTVPSTIAQERATNPFLRAGDAGLRARVAAATGDPGLTNAPEADVFAATRALKDSKAYRDLGDGHLPLSG